MTGKSKDSPDSALQPSDEKLLMESVAEAADIARAYFGKSVPVWHKTGDEPVSEGDLAVNQHIRDKIRAVCPDDGWLSEENLEGHGAQASAERVWILDPIDGTRAFLRGKEDFAVSLALTARGRPVLAAIAQPATGDIYFARRGDGATLNGASVRVKPAARLEGCHMGADEGFFRSARHWPVPWPEMKYVQIGSIALRVAYVASGRLDAAVSLRAKAHWDLAAGHLIVEEAGGGCIDERGEPLNYTRRPPIQPCFAACSPSLRDPILTHLAPAIERRRGRNRELREKTS